MKRPSLSFLCLALLLLGASTPVRAETVAFQGKSVCPIRCEIVWPFERDSAKAKAIRQDKGIVMAVSVQPEAQDSEKSGLALGAGLPYLHVLTVNARLGQTVTGGAPLLTFEMPPDRVISERDHLSRAKLDALERSLAGVNYQLAMQGLQQEEVGKAVSLKTAPPRTARTASLDFEALLKKRDALTAAYEETKARYDDDMQIAHDRFGKDLDLRHFPRKDTIGACVTGRILWMNSSCVPGMVFTKETKLFIIGQTDPILVRAAVHEIAAHKLTIGDQATLTFASLPGQTFHSTIAKIDYMPQSASSQEPSYYQVELSLANPDARIKEGMRCDVSVTVSGTPRQ